MPALKHMKKESPIKKGDVVTIYDLRGNEFDIIASVCRMFTIYTESDIIYNGMNIGKDITVIDSGFVIAKVNGIPFAYDNFFNLEKI